MRSLDEPRYGFEDAEARGAVHVFVICPRCGSKVEAGDWLYTIGRQHEHVGCCWCCGEDDDGDLVVNKTKETLERAGYFKKEIRRI